ncbi:MAG: hypothetical protein QOH20_3698 [Mycobacterium sp.]|jgi:hypothetical protein|nr:hypothetical protein [Mycobacterium sp.]
MIAARLWTSCTTAFFLQPSQPRHLRKGPAHRRNCPITIPCGLHGIKSGTMLARDAPPRPDRHARRCPARRSIPSGRRPDVGHRRTARPGYGFVLAVVLAEAATGALQIPRRALSSLCGLNQRGHPTVSSSRARVETVSDANVPKSVPKPNENGPGDFSGGRFHLVATAATAASLSLSGTIRGKRGRSKWSGLRCRISLSPPMAQLK